MYSYYFFICSQLHYDGHSTVATSLAAIVQADPPCPPSDRLYHLTVIGLKHEPDRQKRNENNPIIGLNPIQEILIGPGLGNIWNRRTKRPKFAWTFINPMRNVHEKHSITTDKQS